MDRAPSAFPSCFPLLLRNPRDPPRSPSRCSDVRYDNRGAGRVARRDGIFFGICSGAAGPRRLHGLGHHPPRRAVGPGGFPPARCATARPSRSGSPRRRASPSSTACRTGSTAPYRRACRSKRSRQSSYGPRGVVRIQPRSPSVTVPHSVYAPSLFVFQGDLFQVNRIPGVILDHGIRRPPDSGSCLYSPSAPGTPPSGRPAVWRPRRPGGRRSAPAPEERTPLRHELIGSRAPRNVSPSPPAPPARPAPTTPH